MSNNEIYKNFFITLNTSIKLMKEFSKSYKANANITFNNTTPVYGRSNSRKTKDLDRTRSNILSSKHDRVIRNLYSEKGLMHGINEIIIHLRDNPYKVTSENVNVDIKSVIDSLSDIDILTHRNENIENVFSIKTNEEAIENIKVLCKAFGRNSDELIDYLKRSFVSINKVSSLIINKFVPNNSDIEKKEKSELIDFVKSFKERIINKKTETEFKTPKQGHDFQSSLAKTVLMQPSTNDVNNTIVSQPNFDLDKCVGELLKVIKISQKLSEVYNKTDFSRNPMQFIELYDQIENSYDKDINDAREVFSSIIETLEKLKTSLTRYIQTNESKVNNQKIILENSQSLEERFRKVLGTISSFSELNHSAKLINSLENNDMLIVCKDLIEDKRYSSKHLLSFLTNTINSLKEFMNMFKPKS